MSAHPSVSGEAADALPPNTAELVERSFALLAPRVAELVDRFYERLFETHPETRAMFPQERSEQNQKLASAIRLVAKSVRRLEAVRPVLVELGTKRAKLGAVPAHYDAVGAVLLETMAERRATHRRSRSPARGRWPSHGSRGR